MAYTFQAAGVSLSGAAPGYPGFPAHSHSGNPNPISSSPSPSIAPPTSLLWTELEPWMDAEYARRVCALMRWEAAPRLGVDPTGTTASNGAVFCVLTFASAAAAANALAQVNAAPVTMPNTTRPFVVGWAPPSVLTVSDTGPASTNGRTVAPVGHAPTHSLSHSVSDSGYAASPASPRSPVSVTDPSAGHVHGHEPYSLPSLAYPPSARVPPTSFPDFTAAAQMQLGQLVGQNPNPNPNSAFQPLREPEYSIFVGDLAPETSNSDLVAVFRNPVLGLRTDRAPPKFIRPFVSCKSAKIMLDPVTGVSRGYGFVRFTEEADQQRALIEMHGLYCLSRPMRISPATAKFKTSGGMAPIPAGDQSYPIAFAGASADGIAPMAVATNANANANPNTLLTDPTAAEWDHHAPARAILGFTSTSTDPDPYNTTVFVGGLSPLVGEETLRTFFVPFGEIHYVKVPVGKHCGFVQFVRKSDAERAIDKMQGFPVGGSRIRLSWGRSQHKAAQAAAQAVQTAALQYQVAAHTPPPPAQPTLTHEQALLLLQKLGAAGYTWPASTSHPLSPTTTTTATATTAPQYMRFHGHPTPPPSDSEPTASSPPHPQLTFTDDSVKGLGRRDHHDIDSAPFGYVAGSRMTTSAFSPFSSAPTAMGAYAPARRDSADAIASYQPAAYSPVHGWDRKAVGSPPANRLHGPFAHSHSQQSISRPSSTREVDPNSEVLHDLNGTLASLDLDRERVA